MTFDPKSYFTKCHYKCTPEDQLLFDAWTKDLPKRTDDLPYHSGADFVNKARMALAISEANTVFEIGTNLCHSASVWLGLGVEKLTTMDAFMNPLREQAITLLEKDHRFNFIRCDSKGYFGEDFPSYDLLFVDGNHDFEWVCKDIDLAERLGIKWIFLDDFCPHHGPDVIRAIEHKGLMPVAIFPTACLCLRGEDWIKRRPE